jgi:hypothetical protein
MPNPDPWIADNLKDNGNSVYRAATVAIFTAATTYITMGRGALVQIDDRIVLITVVHVAKTATISPAFMWVVGTQLCGILSPNRFVYKYAQHNRNDDPDGYAYYTFGPDFSAQLQSAVAQMLITPLTYRPHVRVVPTAQIAVPQPVGGTGYYYQVTDVYSDVLVAKTEQKTTAICEGQSGLPAVALLDGNYVIVGVVQSIPGSLVFKNEYGVSCGTQVVIATLP